MPWKETDRVKERLEFIKAVDLADGTSFTELCEKHGISAKTGYKWVERYEKGGTDALEDLPRYAKKHPLAVDSQRVNAISKLRKEHPRWGPRKLLYRLRRLHPQTQWPAASTVGEILKRQGLVTPRRRRQLMRAPIAPSPVPNEPNDVWAMDFKGHFALGKEGRCHPFTMTDEASRYLLACHGTTTETDVVVRPVLEQCFETYGLPWYIRSDNGNPFGTRTVGGMSRLVIWLVQLGVTPVRIEPGKPQQNGKHERFHLTLKLETVIRDTFDEQQEVFDGFRAMYNDERPHDSLGGLTPSDSYRTSARRLGLLKEPEYDTNLEVRRTEANGLANWHGFEVRCGSLLPHKPIGVRVVADGVAEFRYGPLVLGYFDEAAPSPKLKSEMPSRVAVMPVPAALTGAPPFASLSTADVGLRHQQRPP